MAVKEEKVVEEKNSVPIVTTIDADDLQKPKGDEDHRKQSLWLTIALSIGRAVALLLLLYFFICSLDLMASGFRLVGGRATGTVLKETIGLSNPLVGLMVGILITVLVQSSSTSTSIIVSMTAAGLLDVRSGIPLVMGANVGTSVTSTIVSFSHAGQREDFGRAFAGATVHDCFNWLTVLVMLPLESATGYLFYTTEAIVNVMPLSKNVTGVGGVKVLQTLTDPFTNLIVLLNKTVITEWSKNNPLFDNATLLKTWCGKDKITGEKHECAYLTKYMEGIGDTGVGGILLVFSLLLLFLCMGIMVRMLQKMLKGTMATAMRRAINAEIPKVPWLGGYISLAVGCVATLLLQSSSVVTSLLTPLVGLGLVSLERAYPLTMGSNLGTTGTAIIASLASPTAPPLQMALTHTFFNITGILLFYPIPFMRWPIPMAYALGRAVSRRRWLAILYLLVAFLVLPTFVFTLSRLDESSISLYCIIGLIIVTVFVVIVINKLQTSHPHILPQFLRTWNWLPNWMHNLRWADEAVESVTTFFRERIFRWKCCGRIKKEDLSSIKVDKNENSEIQDVEDVVKCNGNKQDGDVKPSKTSGMNGRTYEGSDNPTYDSSV